MILGIECVLLRKLEAGDFEPLAALFLGQGKATEAAICIREYDFEQIGLTRLICLIHEHNQSSIRVVEKNGASFEKEGWDGMSSFQLNSIGRSNWDRP